MTRWRCADPAVVRAQLASQYLRDAPAESRLGDIILHDHQRLAAGRLRESIARYGGALLADDVGLGKTYTALAAGRDAECLLVVAPAALLSMWRAALARSRRRADVISFEALSRREPAAGRHDLVIVDEAHHARNPRTRRYARLAALTSATRVLLLSATPVHNATADLRALLALFLGSRAERMSAADLASCIVRRTRAQLARDQLPRRSTARWLEAEADPRVLQALIDIPAPCPPRDGGDAGTLVTLSLVRAWASTDAALRSALLRRIARAESLADALAVGRHPTHAELRAWVVGDDATQLAFPELMTDASPATTPQATRDLLGAVRRHAAGARHALQVLTDALPTDPRRCALLREIRQRHPGQRIVVFSHFAESVRAMFSRLAADGRVAAVTAAGAMVAGGPLTRADALARFAPTATGARTPARAEAIDLLLATDLLSEGLNLQDASVVVHLDLPWTAARLTQRMGRIWRLGSRNECVHEYAFAPPASADRLLRLKELLRAKAGAAWAAIGDPFSPLLADSGLDECAAEDRPRAMEALRTLLHEWAGAFDGGGSLGALPPAPSAEGRGGTLIASVRAPFDGWVAVVADARRSCLVVVRDSGSPTTDPIRVLEVARAACGLRCVVSPMRVTRVLAEADAWVASRRAEREAGVADAGSTVRARVVGRIAAVAAAAPPHRRTAVSRLAATAREVVQRARSAGSERLLGALVAPGVPLFQGRAAEEWLGRVIEMGGLIGAEQPTPDVPSEIRAVIVLVSDRRDVRAVPRA